MAGSNIACDPVNVKFNRNNDESKRLKDSRKSDFSLMKCTPRPSSGSIRNFATKSENNNPEKPLTNSCQFCNANHHLDSCEKFCEMAIKKFARHKGMYKIAWSKVTCQSSARKGENVTPAKSFTPSHYMMISRRTQMTKFLMIHPVKKLPILQLSTTPKRALLMMEVKCESVP